MFHYLRKDVAASGGLLIAAIVLDVVARGAFMAMKAVTDALIILIAVAGIALIFAFERLLLKKPQAPRGRAKTAPCVAGDEALSLGSPCAAHLLNASPYLRHAPNAVSRLAD